jgi:hypothetical protein
VRKGTSTSRLSGDHFSRGPSRPKEHLAESRQKVHFEFPLDSAASLDNLPPLSIRINGGNQAWSPTHDPEKTATRMHDYVHIVLGYLHHVVR